MDTILKQYGACDFFKNEVKHSFKNIQNQKIQDGLIETNSEISKIIAILTLMEESGEKSNIEFLKQQLKNHPEFLKYFPSTNFEAKQL